MESLYTKYGGHAFWETVLENFYKTNLCDEILSEYFEGKDEQCIKIMLRGLLSAALKTSGSERPIPVKKIHKYLNIHTLQFDKFIYNLSSLLLENGVTAGDCNEIIIVVNSYRDDIVKD